MLFVTEVYAFKYGNFITACFNGESQTERRFPLQPLHGGGSGWLPSGAWLRVAPSGRLLLRALWNAVTVPGAIGLNQLVVSLIR